VVRQTIDFTGGPISRQREDCALSDEMRSGVVFVQVREDWSERLARKQFPLKASNPWRSCRLQNGRLRIDKHAIDCYAASV